MKLLLIFFQRNAMLAFDAIAKKKKNTDTNTTINMASGFSSPWKDRHLNGGVLDETSGELEEGAGYLLLEMSSCLREIKG